jgi:hypothetical protein
MQYEFIGSYLVFGLVQFLKGSPHRIRSRWLLALVFIFLASSATRSDTLEAHVVYQVIEQLPGKPGQRQPTRLIDRVVTLDPVKHAHVLHVIHEQVNTEIGPICHWNSRKQNAIHGI